MARSQWWTATQTRHWCGTARSATLPGGTKKEQKHPRAAPHSWAKAHLVQEAAYQSSLPIVQSKKTSVLRQNHLLLWKTQEDAERGLPELKSFFIDTYSQALLLLLLTIPQQLRIDVDLL